MAHLALVLLAGCSASRAAKPAAFTSSSASAPPAAPQASGPAQGLVASMRQGVATAGGPGREILVCLQGIRNQSHASAGEFEQMRHRLADALGSAGLDQNPPMLFAAEPAGACDFDLTGTAYLVTASGFDQWELYLDMHRAGEEWSVWRLPGALRMLRHPRPGEAELLIPVNP